MVKLIKVSAREILDSRGNPTIEASIKTKSGLSIASVPSGASKGLYEAVELRDGDKRYNGLGVLKAVKKINSVIAKKLNGKEFDQDSLDNTMLNLDKSKNKSRIGANTMLAVSLAFARASALEDKSQVYEYIAKIQKKNKNKFVMPVPCFNIINGGKHAGNELEIQEFMIAPIGAKNFREALRIGSEVYHKLKDNLKKKFGTSAINVGDEGGFAPPIDKSRVALDFITKTINKLGYAKEVKICMDSAASEFYRDGKTIKYYLDGWDLDKEELLEKYIDLSHEFPIVSIEDPFNQDDFESFADLTKELKMQIVGDDLTATNIHRIKKAIKLKSCNALLLKVNQIGTLTESLQAAKTAENASWNTMVSHRSGETCDDFIADLAVGLGNGQIKAGAPCRGERLAKYNRLLQIEEQLGKKAVYAGKNAFKVK